MRNVLKQQPFFGVSVTRRRATLLSETYILLVV
jgi:hypothetical protein